LLSNLLIMLVLINTTVVMITVLQMIVLWVVLRIIIAKIPIIEEYQLIIHKKLLIIYKTKWTQIEYMIIMI